MPLKSNKVSSIDSSSPTLKTDDQQNKWKGMNNNDSSSRRLTSRISLRYVQQRSCENDCDSCIEILGFIISVIYICLFIGCDEFFVSSCWR